MIDLNQYFNLSENLIVKIKLLNSNSYEYGKIIGIGGFMKSTPVPKTEGTSGTFRRINNFPMFLENTQSFEYKDFNISTSNIESIKLIDTSIKLNPSMIWNKPLSVLYNGENYHLNAESILMAEKNIYYFFISDKETSEKKLLTEHLELVYLFETNKIEVAPPASFEIGKCTNTPSEIIECVAEHLSKQKLYWLSENWPIYHV
ncbi:MAG: hypothetical protein IPJ81_18130 [Chitinophagaceae bacterium]|nr:hypothetical protein [Chitinophagaceae bacterium]